MMWGYNGFGFGGMGIGMLLFWGLIVLGIVALARGLSRNPRRSDGTERESRRRSPLEILRERYAKGEIDKGEFEQKRDDLEKSAGTGLNR